MNVLIMQHQCIKFPIKVSVSECNVCLQALVFLNFQHIPGNLVAELLAGDDGDLLAYSLVCMEIRRQLRVIFLNNHPRGFLDGFCPDATLKNDIKLRSNNLTQ